MSRGLPNKVRISLVKAQDSALLAVETYNKPAIKFKSGGYIVLMTIAWTSLFHSIFFRRGINPYYKNATNTRYLKIENDYWHWELKECLRQYFKSDTSNPIRKNLEFFIKLRNRIEHRSIPEIDSNIYGECQAMLFNFDNMLEKEFGSRYCIREALSFAIQLFPNLDHLKGYFAFKKETKEVLKFIESFRSSVSSSAYESGKYAFKAFLIQVSNYNSADALPVQFLAYDKLTEDQKIELRKIVTLIKTKNHETVVSNKDKLKPGMIVNMVQTGLGNPMVVKNGRSRNKFVMDTHTRCWKKYKVRPEKSAKNPSLTQKEFCVYDEAHEDYLYTEDWVSFLIGKLKENEEEYDSLFVK